MQLEKEQANLAEPSSLEEGEVSLGADLTHIMDSRYKWYIVNTYSGSEETVKLSLLERIFKAGLGESFGEIYVPKMSVEKIMRFL